MRWRWMAAFASLSLAALFWLWHDAARLWEADRDGDRLPDVLEARLAREHLPRIHEVVGGDQPDECLEPQPRPVLFRAWPTKTEAGGGISQVAITYVLLYADDCGPLGHAVDHESFTVFVELDAAQRAWTRLGVVAVAHRGTGVEQRTWGRGDIWVSRNKHANFADFAACGANDVSMDQCLEQGPPPSAFTFVNAGEPDAPLVDDLGAAVHERFSGFRAWSAGHGVEPGSVSAHLEDAPSFSTSKPSGNLVAPRYGSHANGKDRDP